MQSPLDGALAPNIGNTLNSQVLRLLNIWLDES